MSTTLSRPLHADAGIHIQDKTDFADYVKLEWNQKGLINFATNVAPLGVPESAKKAIRDNIDEIGRFPDTDAVELRTNIANFLGMETSNIVPGNGSTEIIRLLPAILVRGGDEVIISQPTFSEYEFNSRVFGGAIVNVVRRREDGWKLVPAEITKAITNKTRIIFICNPNNPTGNLDVNEDILEITGAARRKDITVVVDEAYIDFIDYGLSIMRHVNEFKNLVVLHSWTKFFAIPGIRLGYGITNEEFAGVLMNRKLSYNVNTLAHRVGKAVLADKEYPQRLLTTLDTEKAYLVDELNKLGLDVLPSAVYFLLISLRKTGLTSTTMRERLLCRGIIIRDCSNFVGLTTEYIRVRVMARKYNDMLISAMREAMNE